MELGGNTELTGFNEVDSSELIVLKKIIGNYARKFSDHIGEGYERLVLTMKHVHGTKSSKFEVQARLLANGSTVNSEVTENNLFVAVADALKKIESQAMGK